METWMIVAIAIVAIALVAYFMMHRKVTIPSAPALQADTIPHQPRISSTTGQVMSNPAPPPPPNVTATVVSGLAKAPVGILQHVPVVGGLAVATTKAPLHLVTGVANEAGNVASHIPVLGKPASSIIKGASSVVSSVGSFFGL